MRSLFPAFAVFAICSAWLPAQTVVAPDGLAAVEGSHGNSIPWGRGTASTRFLQIYDSTQFTLRGVTGAVLITRLRFRANNALATFAWAGSTWPNVQIDMSTAAVDFASASATFASNHGPDRKTVLRGPVVLSPGRGNGIGVPGPWYMDIPLTSPIVYDPATGNDLVVDVMLDGNGWTGSPSETMFTDAAGAPGSRVYNITSTPNAATGPVDLYYMLVTEFTCVTTDNLVAGFFAAPRRGSAPMLVQFTDASYSSDPGGITSWAWDFDGDSVVDSTAQNPTFSYGCGTFPVSLTVTDASHSPRTLTQSGLVQTNPIVVRFTDRVIAPLTVQFTDTSSMPATSWSWDLDGDNVPDSTVQNPTWVYANTNPVNVTLTVTRPSCLAASVTRSIVADQRLSTNLSADYGGGPGSTVLMDLNVLNPHGAGIRAFDIITSIVSTPFTIDVYVKPGFYASSVFTPSAWARVGTASGTANGTAYLPSHATLPAEIYLPRGSFGLALRYVGVEPRYRYLPTFLTVGNADLSLTMGAVATTLSGPFLGTFVSSPQEWSGTIYYGTHNVTGQGGYGCFAPGCQGSLGVPGNTSSALPRLGTTTTVGLTRLPMNTAILMFGFSRTNSVWGALPFNMTPLGAPGCFGHVSPDVITLLVGAGNTVSYNLSVPNNAIYLGYQLYNQGLSLDPTRNVLDWVSSDAAWFIVGQ